MKMYDLLVTIGVLVSCLSVSVYFITGAVIGYKEHKTWMKERGIK